MKIVLAITCAAFAAATGTAVSDGCGAPSSHQDKDKICAGKLSSQVVDEIRAMQSDVDSIIKHITVTEKGETWRQLAAFVDKHGPRFTGTTALEKAIDDRVEFLTNIVGKNHVHNEDVQVPVWVRGELEVTLLDAWEGGRNKTLGALSLGFSIGTPTAGLVAEAVVVRSLDELYAIPKHKVQGKIVVFNQPFVRYSKSVTYRVNGAREASAMGAVAALIRSVTGHSLYTPHTGMVVYNETVEKIPAISITVEDAELMGRKQQRGETLRLFIRSTAHLADKMVKSRNTIAELEGNERPNESVVVSGHIDSWDVGQGAMDDGGGVAISWRVLDVLKKLNLHPRRTVRAVLFTAEEMGYHGGHAYFKAHKKNKADVQFIMESDEGTFTPLGIGSSLKNEKGRCILLEALALLKAINATTLYPNAAGPDIEEWFKAGVPGGSLYTDNARYFDYHHTNADTLFLMSPDDLDKATSVWTAISYVLAQVSVRIDHDPSNEENSHH